MIFIIFSDIHSNLEAITSVYENFKSMQYDSVLCCGDIVGYGPQPDECIHFLQLKFGEIANFTVAGNHDWAVAGNLDLKVFNPIPKISLKWTINKIKQENKEILKSLPQRKIIQTNSMKILLVHGSPLDPILEYIDNRIIAYRNLLSFQENICFVGHTHKPFIFFGNDFLPFNYDIPILLNQNFRYIINVGSIGQPRDGNPNSCYAIFDSNKNCITFKRVEYDIAITQQKMLKENLPSELIWRLSYGR